MSPSLPPARDTVRRRTAPSVVSMVAAPANVRTPALRNRTELSALVDASLGLPVRSRAAPAGIDATTAPRVVIPVTSTRYEVSPVWVTTGTRLPPAVLADR